MTQANTLSIDDLIKELDVGRATVKFILKRFSQWLPFDRINGDHLYSPVSIPVMFKIRDLLDAGTLPSQIEEIIEKDPTDHAPADSNPMESLQTPQEGDIRMSKDALGFIQDLFQDIKGHQSRIASAHEKRAEAEERKAVAIEKRAEAEEKKAAAMNNIATALQEMTRQKAVDSETMAIAGQAAHALTMNDADIQEDLVETSDTNGAMELADLEPAELEIGDWEEPDDLDLEDVFDHPDQVEPIDLDDIVSDDLEPPYPQSSEELLTEEDLNLDDLSLLMEEQGGASDELDDLSTLLDTVSDSEAETDSCDLTHLLEEDISLPELDDLSTLVDEVSAPQDVKDTDDLYSLVDDIFVPDSSSSDISSTDTDIDDLFSLVDEVSSEQAAAPYPDVDMDNLSQLVDMKPELPPEDLDNLSLLVDSPANDTDARPLDDLSLIVDAPASAGEPGDDLWTLVDGDQDAKVQDGPLDDLSALIDTPSQEEADSKAPPQPSLKPDITPEQDLAKYKAAVMKIIIGLKNQGLSAGETTDRLNNDQVTTLSGKPKWAEKAIAKIFGFIDSAK